MGGILVNFFPNKYRQILMENLNCENSFKKILIAKIVILKIIQQAPVEFKSTQPFSWYPFNYGKFCK